jgi:hypothetical protein
MLTHVRKTQIASENEPHESENEVIAVFGDDKEEVLLNPPLTVEDTGLFNLYDKKLKIDPKCL